ncbi:MAG: hypothetical protein V4651_02235 [Bacteroidota bacterium]
MIYNHNECHKIECKITEYIMSDSNCSVTFGYYQENDTRNFCVNVVAYNLITRTMFLVGIGKGLTYYNALVDAMKKVETSKKTCSFTIKWSNEGKAIETSYFYAKDVHQLLDKFYIGIGENSNKIMIYEIKLNPES